MNLRWLIGNYALKEYGLDGRTARKLSALARKKYMPERTLYLWTIFAVAVPVVLAVKFALPSVLSGLGMTGKNRPSLVGNLVIIVVFSIWSAWVYKHLYVKAMRRAIAEAGGALCVECGYDLKGLGEGIERCPECGNRCDTGAAVRSAP